MLRDCLSFELWIRNDLKWFEATLSQKAAANCWSEKTMKMTLIVSLRYQKTQQRRCELWMYDNLQLSLIWENRQAIGHAISFWGFVRRNLERVSYPTNYKTLLLQRFGFLAWQNAPNFAGYIKYCSLILKGTCVYSFLSWIFIISSSGDSQVDKFELIKHTGNSCMNWFQVTSCLHTQSVGCKCT